MKTMFKTVQAVYKNFEKSRSVLLNNLAEDLHLLAEKYRNKELTEFSFEEEKGRLAWGEVCTRYRYKIGKYKADFEITSDSENKNTIGIYINFNTPSTNCTLYYNMTVDDRDITQVLKDYEDISFKCLKHFDN